MPMSIIRMEGAIRALERDMRAIKAHLGVGEFQQTNKRTAAAVPNEPAPAETPEGSKTEDDKGAHVGEDDAAPPVPN